MSRNYVIGGVVGLLSAACGFSPQTEQDDAGADADATEPSAILCGSPGAFADTFDGSGFEPYWDYFPKSEVRVEQGRAAMNATNETAFMLGRSYLNMRDSAVSFAVEELVGGARFVLTLLTSDAVFIGVVIDGQTIEGFIQNSGDVSTVGPVPYDRAAHREIQVRDGGDVIHFEVRGASSEWVSLGSLPTVGALETIVPQISLTPQFGMGGSVRLDDFNRDARAAPICEVDELISFGAADGLRQWGLHPAPNQPCMISVEPETGSATFSHSAIASCLVNVRSHHYYTLGDGQRVSVDFSHSGSGDFARGYLKLDGLTTITTGFPTYQMTFNVPEGLCGESALEGVPGQRNCMPLTNQQNLSMTREGTVLVLASGTNEILRSPFDPTIPLTIEVGSSSAEMGNPMDPMFAVTYFNFIAQ